MLWLLAVELSGFGRKCRGLPPFGLSKAAAFRRPGVVNPTLTCLTSLSGLVNDALVGV